MSEKGRQRNPLCITGASLLPVLKLQKTDEKGVLKRVVKKELGVKGRKSRVLVAQATVLGSFIIWHALSSVEKWQIFL